MRCDWNRRPEQTIISCWGDPRGTVIGRAERGTIRWCATARSVDKHGRETARQESCRFFKRTDAEAWLQGAVRGLTARAFGGMRRRRRRR